MATKLFLTETEKIEAEKVLKPPYPLLDGNEKKSIQFSNRDFSEWLAQKLLSRFDSINGWEQSEPIKLGSWARGELCPLSDFDVLFVGLEDKTKIVIEKLNELGLKLRHRYPEDISDWTQGVEAFDILALKNATAILEKTSIKKIEQIKKIDSLGSSFSRELLRAMVKERKARALRHDSIANFLEPNIKYGAGGLRDLEQGLQILALFPKRFNNIEHVLSVLNYYKNFYLTVRQKYHLLGGSDVLVAELQGEISQWFGYKNRTDFMWQVELGLSRVSFYSDWIIAVASTKGESLIEKSNTQIASVPKAFEILNKNPTLLNQYRVRRNLNDLFSKSLPANQMGQMLSKYIRIEQSEDFLKSLFGARFIDRCIPRLRPIFALVQHDQYHRYSVDAHILQALKTTLRLYKRPRSLEGVASITKGFKDFDWQVMLWACIYHDIAKGSGQPHEIEGGKYVREDFKSWGFSKKLMDEVAWVVEKHLILSRTAFRKNLRSSKTWAELSDQGATGDRLNRLAVFTAIDIKATNPEAWNSWKAGLLQDCVSVMNKTEASQFVKFFEYAKKKKVELPNEARQALDPILTESLPHKVLLEDLMMLKSCEKDLPAKIFVPKSHKSRFWVRFHRLHDKPGIFFEFVERIFSGGGSFHQAVVQTLPTYGVYDWFEIKANNPQQFKKLLNMNLKSPDLPRVKFENIEIVSQDEVETVFSFRGLDQRGALINAVKALTQLGLTIRWARVLTWGRQIDDLFGVALPKNKTAKEILLQLEALQKN
ncbi:MAG: HD domain-containing protein [Pseudomonadota bacterium]|nr:HD domain-containing protein [Pseudomonadota bacterium]